MYYGQLDENVIFVSKINDFSNKKKYLIMGWWSSLGSSGQAAAVSGGSGLLGGLISGIAQPIINKKNQRFAVAQTDKAWHRAMDLRKWDNEYNSPAQQMKRLQEAGLNKLLPFIGGGSASAGQAAPTHTPESAKTDFKSPDLSFLPQLASNSFNQLYDLRMKKAGTDKILEEIEGQKIANDKANKTWLQEQKWIAQRENDKAAVLQYDRAIKNMEMNILAEMRGAADYHGTTLGQQRFQKEIEEVENMKQARKLIIEQTKDTAMRNKRLKQLNEWLKTMPNNTQALQTVLWLILGK